MGEREREEGRGREGGRERVSNVPVYLTHDKVHSGQWVR